MEVEGETAKAPERDVAGRRTKGRGVTNSSSTMTEGGSNFEQLSNKGGGSRGPAECAHTSAE